MKRKFQLARSVSSLIQSHLHHHTSNNATFLEEHLLNTLAHACLKTEQRSLEMNIQLLDKTISSHD